MTSPWPERLRRAGLYLSQGDLAGLAAEIRRFCAWKGLFGGALNQMPSTRRNAEADFWDQYDLDLARRVSWTNAADFGTWAFEDGLVGPWNDRFELVRAAIQVPESEPWYGLILGCGDMVAEHGMFVNPGLTFAEVDAYDVSPESVERARRLTAEEGLNVNYHLADVNQIELPPNRYALAVINHAFHHFRRVDRVAKQINQALLPGGVFYTCDYIGPRQLQYSQRQRFYAQMMLLALPDRYRRELDGNIRQRVQSVPVGAISPDEAIRSDEILPAIDRHMRVLTQYNWAGLLYPLLEGLGCNFDATRSEDLAILKFLYELDRVLCTKGEVEPNFTITIAAKK